MNKLRLMSVFVVLAMLFSFTNVILGGAAPTNLVINGSFEQGNLSSCGFVTVSPGSTFITGWTVTGGAVDLHVGQNCANPWGVPDGKQGVDLNGSGRGLHQDVGTTVGQKYQLSFWMAGNDCQENIKSLNVSFGGTVVDMPVWDRNGNSIFNADDWEYHSYEVTATSSVSQLAFVSTTPISPADWCGPAIDAVELVALNADPSVAAGVDPVAMVEGATAENTGIVSDPDGNTVTLSSSVGAVVNNLDGTWSWSFDTNDGPAQSQTVTVTADDENGGTAETTFELTVNNVAPTLGTISVDVALVPVNTSIDASADFTDPGTLDTHFAAWDWGDGTSAGTVTQGIGSGSVNDSHSYSTPGVYTLKLTTTDNDGEVSNEAVYEYVVVYDPNGGFVTGGGWIDSPAGAYTADPSLTGKANFGFVAKYKKGANVPDGNTQFQFKAGDLNFHSSSYEWLVVAGNKAQFKGEGTINGGGSYKFMITADDDSPDTFRIKIWYEENGVEVVGYDNGSQQSLGGGSIVIHK